MKKISTHANHYKLISPDGHYIAIYSGTEIGMGGPTAGNVRVSTKDGSSLFSCPARAPSCFSDDSKYFIFSKQAPRGQFYRFAVIELPSGREVWTEELVGDSYVEVSDRKTTDLFVSGVNISSLEQLTAGLDITRCTFIED